MGLKHTVDKLEDVPENVRTLYKAEGAKFVLDVDGVVPKERLDEFRNNNLQLQQQIDRFKGIDPAKHAELLEVQRQLNEQELIKAGDVEGVVNSRVSTMKSTYDTQINELTTKLTVGQQQLHSLLVDNVIRIAASKNGAFPEALDDVVLRAKGVYTVENGVPTPKDEKGQVIYGKDGKTPMPPEEWVLALKGSAKHLFMGSQGSGAAGGNGHGGRDMSKLTAVEKITMGLNTQTTLQPVPAEIRGS